MHLAMSVVNLIKAKGYVAMPETHKQEEYLSKHMNIKQNFIWYAKIKSVHYRC